MEERSRYSALLRQGLLLPLRPLLNSLPRLIWARGQACDLDRFALEINSRISRVRIARKSIRIVGALSEENCRFWGLEGGLGVGEMNKFNLSRRNIQKEKRVKRAEKRKLRSSAATLRVSSGKALASISGKKARKLQKRWRQAQKEAVQSGLVTMHDIEMMAIDEEGGGDQGSLQPKLPKLGRAFLLKKRAKLKLKSSSSKGKRVGGESVGNPTAEIESADAMIQ